MESENLTSFGDIVQLGKNELVTFCYFLNLLQQLFNSLDKNRLPWSAILHQIDNQCKANSLPTISFLLRIKYIDSDFDIHKFYSICEDEVKEYTFLNKNQCTNYYFSNDSLIKEIFYKDQYIQSNKQVPCRNVNHLPRLPYHSESDTNKEWQTTSYSMGWGQRKLLMMEIEFLCNFASPGDIILYVGAAPGIHIPYLATTLFPFLNFILYDPGIFAFDPITENITNVKIFNTFFRDDDIKLYCTASNSNESSDKNSAILNKLLFISDVRRLQYNEDIVKEDLYLQSEWCKQLRPKSSMLKFRLPYGNGYTSYLKGTILCQAYIGQKSTESRLVVIPTFMKNKDKDIVESNDINNSKTCEYEECVYDNLLYEEQFSYFNTHVRTLLHDHNTTLGITSKSHEVVHIPEQSSETCNTVSSRISYPVQKDTHFAIGKDELEKLVRISDIFEPHIKFTHRNTNYNITSTPTPPTSLDLTDDNINGYWTCTGLNNSWDCCVETIILRQYIDYIKSVDLPCLYQDSHFNRTQLTSVQTLKNLLLNQNEIEKINPYLVGTISIQISSALGWLDSWIYEAKNQKNKLSLQFDKIPESLVEHNIEKSDNDNNDKILEYIHGQKRIRIN
jgi:hypothetical protein